MSLYDELGLPRNCTFDEIKQQYRHLAGIHHPDRGGDAEKFKRIKFAYEVLSNPERRDLYDRTSSTDEFLNIHSEAIQQLSHIFFGVISNVDLYNGNLVDAMKNEVRTLETRNNNEIISCEQFIKNLEVAKEKLILKDPSQENILLGFLQKQLDARLNDMKIFQHRKELCSYMLKILDNYQYGFLEIPSNLTGSE